MSAFEIVFLLEFVALFALRFWYGSGNWAKKVAIQYIDVRERLVMWVSLVGMMILPLIHWLTPLLDFADYTPPVAIGWVGTIVAGLTVWLFWRSHADLGAYWSPTLEVRDQHRVITHGVYCNIRHPMYASIWLWGASQALLLPNWIAGPAGLTSFALLYFVRVSREERMMVENFGNEYVEYMARTGRVIPRWRASATTNKQI